MVCFATVWSVAQTADRVLRSRCRIFLIGCPSPLPLELRHFICVTDSCEVYRERGFGVVAYRYHNLGILKRQREVWASC